MATLVLEEKEEQMVALVYQECKDYRVRRDLRDPLVPPTMARSFKDPLDLKDLQDFLYY